MSNPPELTMMAVPGIPEIGPGDDVASIILTALKQANLSLQANDVLVIAHKIISKAEGRQINLNDVIAGEKAIDIAAKSEKDPRLVELILRESVAISRMKPGLLIVRHRLGFTSANAGIDRSNVFQHSEGESVLLLPEDPDLSALKIRATIMVETGNEIGIVIADSHGRPFRLGTVGVAIGVAGLPALLDRRGEPDRYDYELQHTEVGTADEIASAAGLLMGQAAEGTPVVLLRGLNLPKVQGKATDLVRPKEMDLYR
jgi:coenzyme F420-0:L-glutamate ligase/coenzyme F420-1:gamma-L-glutamate ligase